DPDPQGDGPAGETRSIALYRLEKDDNRVFEFDPEAQSWTAFHDGWTWRWGEYVTGIGAVLGRGATERQSDAATRPKDCTSPTQPQQHTDADDVPELRLAAVNTGVTWRSSRLQDPFGNSIDYTYTEECGCDPGTADAVDKAYACPHLPHEIWFGTAL